MFSALVTMALILALVAGIGLVVIVGIGHHGKNQRLGAAMERAAAHLNGEAEPPRVLVDLMR